MYSTVEMILLLGNKIPITAAIPGRPGGVIRVYRESPTEPKDVPIGSGYIPYCSMAQAQLSFHGHRDAVKFFVVIPGGAIFCVFIIC